MLPASLTPAACGDRKLAPQAVKSVARLDTNTRAAAEPLVDMERLARKKDAATLCSQVYRAEDDSCRSAFRRLMADQEAVSMSIRSVRLLREERGVATVDVTTIDGGERVTRSQTFELVWENGWYVRLQG